MSTFLRLVVVAGVVALLVYVSTGHAQPSPNQPSPNQAPPNQPADQEFSDAVQELKQSAAHASEAVQAEFAHIRESVHNMGVEARVYSRIHWDKTLSAASIEIHMQPGGVAALAGSVPDSLAKAKAVELARNTVGVTNVVDQLTVAPAAP